MSFRWSFSTDKLFRRCQRQFYFAQIPGMVEPLVVRVVRGNLNLEWILEDTFGMSQLCWPVPAGCMRLPVDLKLCDGHLRAFAGRADEDKALFGGTLEEVDELLPISAR